MEVLYHLTNALSYYMVSINTYVYEQPTWCEIIMYYTIPSMFFLTMYLLYISICAVSLFLTSLKFLSIKVLQALSTIFVYSSVNNLNRDQVYFLHCIFTDMLQDDMRLPGKLSPYSAYDLELVMCTFKDYMIFMLITIIFATITFYKYRTVVNGLKKLTNFLRRSVPFNTEVTYRYVKVVFDCIPKKIFKFFIDTLNIFIELKNIILSVFEYSWDFLKFAAGKFIFIKKIWCLFASKLNRSQLFRYVINVWVKNPFKFKWVLYATIMYFVTFTIFCILYAPYAAPFCLLAYTF